LQIASMGNSLSSGDKLSTKIQIIKSPRGRAAWARL